MARWNLKVNYGTVRDVADSAKALATGVDNVKNELKNVYNAITACAGAAITVLEEKSPEIDTNLDKLKEGLNSLGDVFYEYAENMLGIINYGDGGIDNVVHINTEQVENKLKKMVNEAEDFTSYASSVNPSVDGGFFASFVELSDADKASLSNINGKLENIKEMMVEVANYISQFEDDFEKMRGDIKDYEDMDDDMKAKIKDIYEELADIKWWQTTTFKVIVGATLIVAAVAIIVFVPAAAVGVAGFALGVAKGVVAFGALNATVGGIAAYFSGDDIEDAVATGLFEGTIEGLFVGGASQAGKVIGKAVAKSSTGQKLIANSKYVTADNMVKFFDFNTEYLGQVANTVFKKAYNEQDINMKDIALSEALKHSWKAMDKVAMSDINKFFKNRANAIINSSDDIADFSKMAGDLLLNDGAKKLGQYTTKAGIYFGQIGVDSVMNELNSSVINDENMSLSDIYDSVSGQYDGTKLLKYVFKDDFKDVVKKQISKLALHK